MLNRHLENVLGDVQLKRPGSAPPQMDELVGSPMSNDGFSMFLGHNHSLASQGPSEPPDNGMNMLENEQDRSFRSDPAYIKYYYANKNINPRLPPPILSREQVHHMWMDKQEGQGLSDSTDTQAALNLLFGTQLGGIKENAAPIAIQDSTASILSQGLNLASSPQHDQFGSNPWANAAANDSLESLLQAYSPKTHSTLQTMLSGDLGKASNAPSLYHVPSGVPDDFQESLFANSSAPHTPRNSGAQLFVDVQSSPRSVTPSSLGTLGVAKDPKVSLPGFGSSTPRAIGERHHRATPSKLRIGSTNADAALDLPGPSNLSSQGFPDNFPNLAGLAAALPGVGASEQPAPVNPQQPSHGTNGGDALPGLFGNQPMPTPQQMQAMYMAAAAMYPYYSQQQQQQQPGINFQAAMQAAAMYPGFMGFPSGMPMGYPGFPMMPGPGGFSNQMPGMPDLSGMRPPPFPMMPLGGFPNGMPPFPLPNMPADYANYYQKLMETQAAAVAAMMGGERPKEGEAASGKDGSKPGGSDDGIGNLMGHKRSNSSFGRGMGHGGGDDAGRPGASSGRDRAGSNRNTTPGRDSRAGSRGEGGMDAPRHPGSGSNSRRGSRRDDSGAAGDRRIDALLEEFKTNKNRKFEFTDIFGHIYEFSLDQHGSRFIQQKLEAVPPEELATAFKEVLPKSLQLMTDVFGNYVVQKFLEHGTDEQRLKLAQVLKGNVLHLSLQMYGCRVIQKSLEVLPVEQQCEIISELDGHVMRCVRDQNGNHVIQKVIECVSTDRIEPLLDNFMTCVVPLSTHPFGCRVIQRILEHCQDQKRRELVMDEILKATCQLAQDQYGNYVTQHVLEHGRPEERLQIVNQLAPQILAMSLHKFASNVVEKCLTHCSTVERDILIRSMLGDGSPEDEDPLQQMMKDQFGNYVVQKVLEVCDDQQREVLLNRVRLQLHALKKYTYGKHIVARVEKLLSTGTKLQTNAKSRALPDDQRSGVISPPPPAMPSSPSSASGKAGRGTGSDDADFAASSAGGEVAADGLRAVANGGVDHGAAVATAGGGPASPIAGTAATTGGPESTSPSANGNSIQGIELPLPTTVQG